MCPCQYSSGKVSIQVLTLVPFFLQLPQSYQFTMMSDAMLTDSSVDLSSLLSDAAKMFPSQRHAIFKKLYKTSVGDFVANVTKLDVAEEMLEFMPPDLFRSSLPAIREKLNQLSDQDLVNVAYFPASLVIFSFYF